jgi:nucleotide-binding universal stress UspA family protein
MYKNILVAIDLEDKSDLDQTLSKAVALVQCGGTAKLHVMTVLPTLGMSWVGQFFPQGFEKEAGQKCLERLRQEVDQRLPEGMKAHHIVGEGNVYESVLKIAEREQADLIVIGAHRPELADYLLGPNAARVVRHAKVSVLVVRS